MPSENDFGPIYREVQQFRQLWLWAVVLIVAGLMWYMPVSQLLVQRPGGNIPMLEVLLPIILWLLFGLGLPALFLFSKLITEVRQDGIYIQFFPFHLSFRHIPFTELKRYEPRTYRPIREYGGWGIRYGSQGRAYNVSGNRGLQLEFWDGRRLLIGSQRPEEFRQAIEQQYGQASNKQTRRV